MVISPFCSPSVQDREEFCDLACFLGGHSDLVFLTRLFFSKGHSINPFRLAAKTVATVVIRAKRSTMEKVTNGD
jgi:hypothetical protein